MKLLSAARRDGGVTKTRADLGSVRGNGVVLTALSLLGLLSGALLAFTEPALAATHGCSQRATMEGVATGRGPLMFGEISGRCGDSARTLRIEIKHELAGRTDPRIGYSTFSGTRWKYQYPLYACDMTDGEYYTRNIVVGYTGGHADSRHVYFQDCRG